MLGDGEGKIHFHPENRAQPVPTSAPLAWAQASSLCRGAQLPPNMAMLWSCFPPCWQGSHRAVGARSLEGSGCRGQGLVQSSLYPAGSARVEAPQCRSEGSVAATSHPGLPARPGGSGGGREGGRAPCPAPGFSEGCKGQWEAGGAPLLLGEGRAALGLHTSPWLPTPERC